MERPADIEVLGNVLVHAAQELRVLPHETGRGIVRTEIPVDLPQKHQSDRRVIVRRPESTDVRRRHAFLRENGLPRRIVLHRLERG